MRERERKALEMNQTPIFTVHHEGELNAVTSAELKTRMQAAIAEGHRFLVVDLSHVPFIDSSGLGALVSGLKSVKLAGGELVLAGLQEKAATIFSITSAHRLFEIHPTAEAASSSLAARVAQG